MTVLANTVQVSAKLDGDLRGNTFTFTNQAEQDVLRADVVVTQLQRYCAARARGPSRVA